MVPVSVGWAPSQVGLLHSGCCRLQAPGIGSGHAPGGSHRMPDSLLAPFAVQPSASPLLCLGLCCSPLKCLSPHQVPWNQPEWGSRGTEYGQGPSHLAHNSGPLPPVLPAGPLCSASKQGTGGRVSQRFPRTGWSQGGQGTWVRVGRADPSLTPPPPRLQAERQVQ